MLERLLDKVNSFVVAPSRRRDDVVQFAMRVAGVEELGAHQRRVRFTAPELERFAVTGPDEYFALLIPHPEAGLRLPDPERVNPRQALAKVPEHQRPELRWYTVRAHRPPLGEIDVDFVVHDHAGPATRWVAGARPGDEVGFRAGGSSYQHTGTPQVLVADESALPALSAILESVPADAELAVYLEVSDGFTPPPIRSAARPKVLRVDGQRGDAVVAALTADRPADPGYAWVCGEAGMVARVRRHLLREVGLHRQQVYFSGYWKDGRARG